MSLRRTFSPSVLAVSAVMLALFAAFTRYDVPESYNSQVQQYYTWLLDVEMMIFIGFGSLMTFLRKYSYSAVGLNFFASCLVMVEAILCLGATQQVWGHAATHISLNLPLLVDAAFCAGAAMIAFGAVLGKTTPTQLLWLLFLMVPLYAVNQHIVFELLEALDVGGSITIHVFGAYYGLAASMLISTGRQSCYGATNAKNSASYVSNIFSIIGTLFLWMFWPSFNGALASIETMDTAAAGVEAAANAAFAPQQYYCVTNTLISLLGSCIAAFGVTAAVNDAFDMMHIQNATLAGGVAMGSAAALALTPGGALAVGLCAGSISTLGFAYLMPYLERTIRLGDTCGVHNLHGIPGILGGLVAGFAAFGQDMSVVPHHSAQLGYQIAAILVTMALAIAGGVLAGALVSRFNPLRESVLDAPLLFDDGAFWTGVDIEPHEDTTHKSAMGIPSIHGGSAYHAAVAAGAVSGPPTSRHIGNGLYGDGHSSSKDPAADYALHGLATVPSGNDQV
eukprot:jgi/Chrzof1/269/Cz01g09120.t1